MSGTNWSPNREIPCGRENVEGAKLNSANQIPGFRYTIHTLSTYTPLTLNFRCNHHFTINDSLTESVVAGMFTPVHTTLGSLLLFQGSSGLLIHNGAVFGISSLISSSVLNPNSDNVPIIAGLISSVIPVYLLVPSLIPHYPQFPDSLYSAAATLALGFLLGWGTKVRDMPSRATE